MLLNILKNEKFDKTQKKTLEAGFYQAGFSGFCWAGFLVPTLA